MKTGGFRAAVLLLMLLQYSNYAITQTKTVGGKIVDSRSGNPIANVSIAAPGTGSGTTTDSAGRFSLLLPLSVNQLMISSIGYRSQEVEISGITDINLSLESDYLSLNDVIVIGYGTSRKIDLTGAVGSVKEKDFNRGIFSSPDQLLQGRIAGIQITYNNGQPGGAANIKIRGNSALTGTGQPLYVIDGVPLDGRSVFAGTNPLNFINPDDIASIDVLKDASASAIYGSRAAYGVMIINTKKGQSGQPKLLVNMNVGMSTLLKDLKVLNAEQYRRAIQYYDADPNNDHGGNVNALNEILQNGFLQNYTVAVSGGAAKGKYRISGNYLDQQGIIRNTGFKKYTADVVTDFLFLEKEKLGLDLHLMANQYIQDLSAPAEGLFSQMESALTWNPTDSLYNEDGSVRLVSGGNLNPVARVEYVKDKTQVSTILGSITPFFRFATWLEYRLSVSVNYNTGISRSSVNELLLNISNPIGSAAIRNNEQITTQLTQTLKFDKEIFKSMKLNALAGFEYLKFNFKGSSMTAYGVPGIGFGNYGLDYTNYIQFSNTSGREIVSFIDPTTELQSFFARAIVNYKDRYLLTLTFRTDGSTKFGENNKYGLFPSFAAAWNISNESFFHSAFFDVLKLRGGWGITGNQEFPPGSAQAKYTFRNNGTIIQANNPNPDLKWQEDKQINLGIDFAVWDSRLSGSIDVYKKTTTNLLFPGVPIQPAPQVSTVRWMNLEGEIINKGLELLINADIIRKKDISWNIGFNASFLSNNVRHLDETIQTGFLQGSGVSGTTVEVIQNDLPMNSFYTRKYTGMDKSSGLPLYQDDGNSFFYVGNPNPRMLAGFNTQVRYKMFSLVMNMYGSFGQKNFYNTELNLLSVGNMIVGKNISENVFSNPVKESPTTPVLPSSRYVIKGDYFKLANLTLSFDPSLRRRTFDDLSIYVTAQNLFLITRYPGFDPESNFDGSNNGVPSLGIDFAQYPSARSIILGIKFSLR